MGKNFAAVPDAAADQPANGRQMPQAHEPIQKLLFTAPWDAVPVRRGDALGLRGLADRIADILAPDLSNRIRDARWITIIAWCLARSHEVWARAGQSDLANRFGSAERYAWLRPLELMWIARTISRAPDEGRGRQLAGQRRVRRWVHDGCRAPKLGMSAEQFKSYRQAGIYGGYRVIFRRIPGLTKGGDGWTPSQSTQELAKWLDRTMGKQSLPTNWDETAFKWSVWRGNEEGWWRKVWPNFIEGSSATPLPCKVDDHSRLPESKQLVPFIFGDSAGGRRRKQVAKLMGNLDAADHLELCTGLARELAKEKDAQILKILPAFSKLADAGMDVMDEVGRQLMSGGNAPSIAVADLASVPAISHASEALRAAARAWQHGSHTALLDGGVVDDLARAVSVSSGPERIAGLVRHHEKWGGALKWFVLRHDSVVPRLLFGANDSSRYRFRLWSLGRLAAQCGVADGMPDALVSDNGSQLEAPITDDSGDHDQAQESP